MIALDPTPRAPELEPSLLQVEEHLQALSLALVHPDPDVLAAAADRLHRSLARAVEMFRGAARRGHVDPLLRQRLAMAGAQVAAQREALGRATASLDRAMDLLMPSPAPAQPYSPRGSPSRPASSGSMLA